MLSGNSASGYQVQRSLRFRASASAYLNRTPAGAGNAQRFTYSTWVKRGGVAADQTLISAGVAGNRVMLILDSTGYLRQDDSGATRVQSSSVYRDPAAFYHIVWAVDTTQATAANRNRFYVNNVEVTAFSVNTAPGLNFNWPDINAAALHRIGSTSDGVGRLLDGCLADTVFVDGQQLTPPSFGQVDSNTNQWCPKRYAGTYGTNGFYLDFRDNSSTTNLCLDRSGNGNNWTPNNISLTAGATYDSMTDVPLAYGTTDRGNYCTLNPLSSGRTQSAGNLQYSGSATGIVKGGIAVSAGKWYWEYQYNGGAAGGIVGVAPSEISPAIGFLGQTGSNTGYGYYSATGSKYGGAGGTAYGASFTTSDIIGVALDMDAGTITFYKNNTSQGIAFSGLTGLYLAACGNSTTDDAGILNFGQRPFTYTPPSGFKALHTGNLPTPSILKSKQHFDIVTRTGTSASYSVTGIAFQPDFAWIKDRAAVSQHVLTDSSRGVTKQLFSSLTNAEQTSATGITSFNADGYSGGANPSPTGAINSSPDAYVDWLWKAGGAPVTNNSGSISSQVSANAVAGFSVVTYTGNQTAGATFGHGLGIAPRLVIIKSRGAVTSWPVYHAAMGGTDWILLNSSNAKVTSAQEFNSVAPSSSVVTIGNSSSNSNQSSPYVAYCFAEIPGYSKIGGYTGNGSSDGTFVYCDFRPRYVLIKRTDSAGDWQILDAARSLYNLNNLDLYTNLSNAEEVAGGTVLDFTSNGFKLRGTHASGNASGGTYIYLAIAEAPLNYALAR